MSHVVLVIDDDIEIHSQLRVTLNNYDLLFAVNVAEAKRILETSTVDLIILDVSLPDGDGLMFFLELQSEKKYAQTPVMFLTSRSQTNDKVAGLSLGAEDYVTKPFDRMELKARVALRLRKKYKEESEKYLYHKKDLLFELLSKKLHVTCNGEKFDIPLTAFEFKLLLFMAQREGQVLTRRYLLDSVWGADLNVVDRTIDAHVSNLRKKIKKSSYTIRAIYGEGYQFTETKKSLKKSAA